MDIVEKIQKSRDKIKDIRATYKWLQDDKLTGTFQWGWKQGKQFLVSSDFAHAPNSTLTHISTDGQKEYSLEKGKQPREISQLNDSFEYIGTINKIRDYSIFAITRTPMSFLKIDHCFPLAEYLPKAETITVRPELETINGASCTVLEARNIIIGGFNQSLLVWIDTARDYHTMKFEGYRHKRSKHPYKKNALYTQIDNISLKQANGFWFPVSGSCRHFHRKMFRRKPGTLIRLKIETIQINQGIDDNEFRIQFPSGTAVYDEFTGKYNIIDAITND